MEFYPLSFTIEPGQRKIYTALTGKKIALSDVVVNLRGVNGDQNGEVTSLDFPSFEIKRDGEGHELSWDRDIEQDLEVIIEAQSNGGQITRAGVFLHLPRVADAPVIARPGLDMSPVEKAKALIELGMDRDEALKIIEDKLGPKAGAEARKGLIKELTDG